MSAGDAGFGHAERVAESVLYEGYVLYPYRWSAVKNRRRWSFGMVFPPAYCESQDPSESSSLATEVLLEAGPDARLRGKLRFLQAEGMSAARREVALEDLPLSRLQERPFERPFRFGPLDGRLTLAAEPAGPGVVRLRLEVRNEAAFAGGDRDAALGASMAGTHAVLGVRDGAFVSRVDPPPGSPPLAPVIPRGGLWTVLVGGTRRADVLLASPILLEDDPRVAPQSHGDLFDLTEIEEMLRLRVLTLTDEEKEQMRRGDERCRAILERSESLSGDELLKLHGTMTPTAPIRPGAKVRVQPRRRADILDTVLAGRVATVVAVEQDLEDRLHVAVVFDEDPGREWGLEGRGGHRFFFHEDEVEPL